MVHLVIGNSVNFLDPRVSHQLEAHNGKFGCIMLC